MTDHCKASEQWRHECEVRDLVQRYRDQGSEVVRQYLKDCARHRGDRAAAKLRADALRAIGYV